jgi:Arc/MetJ family transcription regulator
MLDVKTGAHPADPTPEGEQAHPSLFFRLRLTGEGSGGARLSGRCVHRRLRGLLPAPARPRSVGRRIPRVEQNGARSSGKGLDCGAVIFKRIGDGRPYPDHGKRHSEWAQIPPRQVRLEELVTTKRQLDLDTLLATDSTYYGDLFAHVVQWDGELYLEDGLHRAVRAALQQRPTLHARVLDLDTGTTTQVTDSERSAS